MTNQNSDRLTITSKEFFKVSMPTGGLDKTLLGKLDCLSSIERLKKPGLLIEDDFPTGDMICHFATLPWDHPSGITPTIVLSILEQYRNTVWPHPLLALSHLFAEYSNQLDMYNDRYITSVNFHEPWTREWLMEDHHLDSSWKPKKFKANGLEFIDLFTPVLQEAKKVDLHIASPSGLSWPGDTFVFFTRC